MAISDRTMATMLSFFIFQSVVWFCFFLRRHGLEEPSDEGVGLEREISSHRVIREAMCDTMSNAVSNLLCSGNWKTSPTLSIMVTLLVS